MRAQFGHVRFDFQRLLKLANCLIQLPLALKGNSHSNMGRDILRIGIQNAAKRCFRLLKLTGNEVGFPQKAMRFEVIGEVFEKVLD